MQSLVHMDEVGRHWVEPSESSKQKTFKYHLRLGNGFLSVCKKMFLNTTGITQHCIRSNCNVCDSKSMDGQQPKTPVTSYRMEIKHFVKSLYSKPSHYCRKTLSKIYEEPVYNSKAELYQEYGV